MRRRKDFPPPPSVRTTIGDILDATLALYGLPEPRPKDEIKSINIVLRRAVVMRRNRFTNERIRYELFPDSLSPHYGASGNYDEAAERLDHE